MGATGDVEVFDGTLWRPVSSLLKDPAAGSREGPRPDRPNEHTDADAAESDGSAAGLPDEPEQF